MADNQNQNQNSDNSDQQNQNQDQQNQQQQSQGWKGNLNADMQNSPLVQKFDDSPEGLSKFAESHLNLEKLLGHEKVPIPKDENDTEGWARFNKAMGIPDDVSGYQLEDVDMPEGGFTKEQFAQVMHDAKATPAQANKLWKQYNELNKASYQKAVENYKGKVTEAINKLRLEWGDAYEPNIELGQAVINQFSDDQEMNDFLTGVLSSDAKGIKFLQKLGKQFAENKIGDFTSKRFSMSPSEAKNELDKIYADPNHPYNNKLATPEEHQQAVDRVNSLISASHRVTG